MLDVFLAVASGKTKKAEAQAHTEELLSQLPDELLQKIACGGLSTLGGSDGSWLDKFKGTPLLDQAIALEKEDLNIQMEENERRHMESQARAQFGSWEETSAKRDDLAIKRKLLDLELAGANVGGQEGEDLAPPPEPAMAPAPMEAPPVAEPKPPVQKTVKETTEKPPEEKVDIKTAAAAMRFSLALMQKEAAEVPGLKNLIHADRAYHAGSAAGRLAGTAAGLSKGRLQGAVGGAALGAGAYALGKKVIGDKQKEAQPADRAAAFRGTSSR